jgi:hypothetical protein
VVSERIALNTFAPNWIIEIADLIMAALLSAVLLSKCLALRERRCWARITARSRRYYYVRQLKELLVHGAHSEAVRRL